MQLIPPAPLPDPELDAALGVLDAARRAHRSILRRRALALAGVAAVYAAWAAGAGGLAWAGLGPLVLAGAFVAAQLRAPPGRDFREAVRCLMLPRLGAGIAHRHRPAGAEAELGPLAAGPGWTVEDRIDGPGWTLLSARHPGGRGLLLGRAGGEAPREVAWSLPAPLLDVSWDRPVAELRADLDRLGAACAELRGS